MFISCNFGLKLCKDTTFVLDDKIFGADLLCWSGGFNEF